jgi:hypothetical protein
MEKNLFRCIPKCKKTSSVVSHNEKKPLPLYPTMEENIFHCGIQQKKYVLRCGFHWKKIVCHPEIFFCCIPQQKITSSVRPTAEKNSSVISHNGKKLLPLYPTTAKKR